TQRNSARGAPSACGVSVRSSSAPPALPAAAWRSRAPPNVTRSRPTPTPDAVLRGLERQGDREVRAAFGGHRDAAAEGAGQCADAQEAEAGLAGSAVRSVADAVVDHLEVECVGAVAQAHADGRRPCVLGDVRERLLHDAIYGRLELGRETV